MVDLIPEGCISLRFAFDRFSLWGGQAPILVLHRLDLSKAPHRTVAEKVWNATLRLTDVMLTEFRHAFCSEELKALVREPGASEYSTVPADTWESTFNSERVFLADEVGAGHDGYWSAMAGRTPFVRSTQFEPWLRCQIDRRADLAAQCSPTAKEICSVLIDLVFNGIVGAEDAEEWVEAWGLPPFVQTPSKNEFDPTKFSRWTLAMTVAWIVWRDLDRVREAIDEYRTKCTEWVPCAHCLKVEGSSDWYDVRGNELKSLSPLTLYTLGMIEAVDEPSSDAQPQRTVRGARENLWRCLADGKIDASGIRESDGSVVTIPAHEWPYLQLDGSLKGPDRLVTKARTTYTGITIPRPAILAIWPGEATVGQESPDEGIEIPARASRKIRPARKFDAVQQAAIKLYGAVSQIPDHLTKDEIHDAIVAELRRKKPKAEVSWSTIERVRKSR